MLAIQRRIETLCSKLASKSYCEFCGNTLGDMAVHHPFGRKVSWRIKYNPLCLINLDEDHHLEFGNYADEDKRLELILKVSRGDEERKEALLKAHMTWKQNRSEKPPWREILVNLLEYERERGYAWMDDIA